METNIDKKLGSEKEIDLIDLGKRLWDKRKFILKVSLMGLVIGVIVGFSIPREYETTVILAPEANTGAAGNAGALAAMAGINLGGRDGKPDGDIAPALYPNIVESTPFIFGLFNIKVLDSKNEIDTTLYYYIKDGQKKPWWSKLLGLPGGIIAFFTNKKIEEQTGTTNNLYLTVEQTSILNNLKNRIGVVVDKKTGIITLTSTMQDPKISAMFADTLTTYLQSYVISYRTQKARQDLAFTEKLFIEAKRDYLEMQQKYAKYLDENQNIILASYRVNQEKLQNEVALTYSVYNQMAQQLQMAKVKVQDTTPVYTIIQPAIIPLFPSKPNRKLIVSSFVLLSVIASSCFVLAKEIWTDIKNK